MPLITGIPCTLNSAALPETLVKLQLLISTTGLSLYCANSLATSNSSG